MSDDILKLQISTKDRSRLLVYGYPNGAAVIQVGVDRGGSMLEWNYVRLPPREVKRLVKLLTGGGR